MRVLEQLFPKTIDSMRKESANYDGPKPILLTKLSDYDKDYVIKRLLIPEGVDTFGANQAIIVRNEAAKDGLPQWLLDKKGLVLTIEECKGLEYDDVIVFNFFDPNLDKLWRVLKYTDIYPDRGEKIFTVQAIES